MKKTELVQALCEHFEIDLDEYGGEVTNENMNDILNSYDFISGANFYGRWVSLTLAEVVKALEQFCEDDWD